MTAPLTDSRINEIRGNPDCATHDEIRVLCDMRGGVDARRWIRLCLLLDGSGIFSIPFNANDTFGYACADCVEAETAAELGAALDAYALAGWGGVMAWMENKTGNKVIKEHRGEADKGHAALATQEQTR